MNPSQSSTSISCALKISAAAAANSSRKESRVMRNDQRRFLRLRANVLRDRSYGEAHVWKREFLGDNCAPAGRSEMNRRNSHSRSSPGIVT